MAFENIEASNRLALIAQGYKVPDDKALVIPRSRAVKLDEWVNESNNFGIQHATNQTEFFRQTKKLEAELSPLYEDDWACRKGVDMPAEDMTRKGISFLHNEDDENEIATVEKLEDILVNEWDMMSIACEAIKFARLSGGCASMFMFGGSEIDQRDPIEESQIRELRWVRNFPSWLAVPISWYTDFDHPKLGQPEHYQVNFRDPSTSRTVIVHESRMLIMQGRIVTPNTKALNRGWNDSYIQALYNALRDFQVASSSASGVMQDFNWFSLGIQNLADKVMHSDDDAILERIYLARQKLQNGNLSVYDAEGESMERHSTTVTGMDSIWDRFGDTMCGSFDIPRSLFFSAETGDLGGDSSESDRSNYFDRRQSDQETKLRPWTNGFIRNISLVNQIDDSTLRYEFNPMRQKSSKEVIEERNMQAQTDVLYIQNNVVTPEEVAESRFSKSQPDLDTMNIDFDEREEQAELEETNEDQNNEIRQIIENALGKQPEEREDSQPINVDVKVEAPEIKMPAINIEKKSNDELVNIIKERLDKLEESKKPSETHVIDL